MRLEYGSFKITQFALAEFQFHKGAIGVWLDSLGSFFGTVFQFHKGAIGVMIFTRLESAVTLFQFHKGAIGVGLDRLHF